MTESEFGGEALSSDVDAADSEDEDEPDLEFGRVEVRERADVSDSSKSTVAPKSSMNDATLLSDTMESPSLDPPSDSQPQHDDCVHSTFIAAVANCSVTETKSSCDELDKSSVISMTHTTAETMETDSDNEHSATQLLAEPSSVVVAMSSDICTDVTPTATVETDDKNDDDSDNDSGDENEDDSGDANGDSHPQRRLQAPESLPQTEAPSLTVAQSLSDSKITDSKKADESETEETHESEIDESTVDSKSNESSSDKHRMDDSSTTMETALYSQQTEEALSKKAPTAASSMAPQILPAIVNGSDSVSDKDTDIAVAAKSALKHSISSAAVLRSQKSASKSPLPSSTALLSLEPKKMKRVQTQMHVTASQTRNASAIGGTKSKSTTSGGGIAVDLSKFAKEDLFKLAQKSRRELKFEKTHSAQLAADLSQLKNERAALRREMGAMRDEKCMLLIKNESYTNEITRLNEETTALKRRMAATIEMERQWTDSCRTVDLLKESLATVEKECEQKLATAIANTHKLQLALKQSAASNETLAERLKETIVELDAMRRRHALATDKCEDASAQLKEARERLQLQQSKMDALLEENASAKYTQELKIGKIEEFHAKKYHNLLDGFKLLQKRLQHLSGDGDDWLPFEASPGFGSAVVSSTKAARTRRRTMGPPSLTTHRSATAESSAALSAKRSRVKSASASRLRGIKKWDVNLDYLKNVLVQFLMLAEQFSDAQTVLIPVLASVLHFSKKEKRLIDEAYNGNRYFLEPNTLFPKSATPRKSAH